MTIFGLLSVLVSLAALFSLVSYRVLRLPTSIGTTLLALMASALLIAGGHAAPGVHAIAEGLVSRIDFNEVVLHGMLAFLLFAGALQLDLRQLQKEKFSILSLSIFGTVLSTFIVALLFRVGLHFLGIELSGLACLLFGALISPTDPIAVLDMLRRVAAPVSLQTQLAGESLFNDGVGAVIFVALLDATQKSATPRPGHIIAALLLQAGGGIALGLILGYAVYRLLCLVDSYRVEVLLTLALAMGGYALADALHLSAPLEVVTAGLLVSGRARRLAMSTVTRENVDTWWELIDDIMNVVLFLLVGLQLLVLPVQRHYVVAGLLAIPIVLLARWLSVVGIMALVRFRTTDRPNFIGLLTWGGLRGGLALALALSLPQGTVRSMLLTITYAVVVFSIVVQGLTVGPLLQRTTLRPVGANIT